MTVGGEMVLAAQKCRKLTEGGLSHVYQVTK